MTWRKICKDNAWCDKDAWAAIDLVLKTVGAIGMSGEETDQKYSSRNKDLSKVPTNWIHPDLVDLFAMVDTSQLVLADMTSFIKKWGNRPHPPPSTTQWPVQTTPALRKLPWNWYHEMWLKAQNPVSLALLQVEPPCPLPHLVSVHGFSLPVISPTITPRNLIINLEVSGDACMLFQGHMCILEFFTQLHDALSAPHLIKNTPRAKLT